MNTAAPCRCCNKFHLALWPAGWLDGWSRNPLMDGTLCVVMAGPQREQGDMGGRGGGDDVEDSQPAAWSSNTRLQVISLFCPPHWSPPSANCVPTQPPPIKMDDDGWTTVLMVLSSTCAGDQPQRHVQLVSGWALSPAVH